MNSVPSPSVQAPRLAGFRFGPSLTGTLYLLLLAAAGLALWVRRAPQEAPSWALWAAPWLFFAFLTGFAFYRAAMVRARLYPAAKAIFQIGAGALLLLLLVPPQQNKALQNEDSLQLLLKDANPHSRAVAAELVRHRPDGARYGARLVKMLGDPNPDVRRQAHDSLVVLAGSDLGSPDDSGALARWRERFP